MFRVKPEVYAGQGHRPPKTKLYEAATSSQNTNPYRQWDVRRAEDGPTVRSFPDEKQAKEFAKKLADDSGVDHFVVPANLARPKLFNK